MTWTFRRLYIRVTIAGTVIRTTSDVHIVEALDQGSRTADFLMAVQPDPEPAEGDSVLIEFVDDEEGKVYPLYGGTINSAEVESEPWAYSILCLDQLEKLRATRKGGDLDLTGMTDGEAWKAVADYCAITYDDADIADAGYVLGQQQSLAWHDDESSTGLSVIQELDNVFGMTTMTIGDNQVIRIPIDYTPNDDVDLYRTYTKGTDVDWNTHHRSKGNRDQIQNVWRITGASIESSDGSCTATPWAYAVSGNAQLGRRVRIAPGTFSSDFIQDESLAAAIIRRNMRQTNRDPIRSNLTVVTDVNLHPAHKVKLVDSTYGINTPVEHLCLVNSVDRSGLTMTADLTCGPAGSIGTVTTGVDQVCGDDHTNTPIDDGFDPPEPLYPPLDDGTSLDLSDLWDDSIHPSMFVGGAPAEDCIPPADAEECVTHDWSVGRTIGYQYDWEITGTLTLNANTDALTLGIDSDDGFYRFRIAGGAYYDPLVGAFKYELLAPSTSHRLPGYAVIGQAISWRLKWEHVAKRLTFYAEVGDDICYADVILEPSATMTTPVTWESVSGTPTRASEEINFNCGIGSGGSIPAGRDWVLDESLTGSSDVSNDFHFISSASGGFAPAPESLAHIDLEPAWLADFKIEGYWELGSEFWEEDMVIGSDAGGLNLEWVWSGNSYATVSPHRELQLIGFGSVDGNYTNDGIPFIVALAPILFTLTVRFSTNTVSLELSQDSETWSISHTGTDWYSDEGDTALFISSLMQAKTNTTTGESITSVQTVTLL